MSTWNVEKECKVLWNAIAWIKLIKPHSHA